VFANGECVTCTIAYFDQETSVNIVEPCLDFSRVLLRAGDFGITTNAGTLAFGGGVVVGTTTTYTSTTLTGLSAGTKSLHENLVAGYTDGTWGCTGAAGTVNGDPQTGSVVIANGESVTCTITNDDQATTLKIVKICAPTTDTGTTFTGVSVTGLTGTVSVTCNVTAGTVINSLSAGEHTVSETIPPGWAS